MTKKKNKNKFNSDYLISVAKKILESLISVKVWIIFSILGISTILLKDGFISGQVWGTVNTAVISTIAAIREGFKVSKAKDISDIEKVISLGKQIGMNKEELYKLMLNYQDNNGKIDFRQRSNGINIFT